MKYNWGDYNENTSELAIYQGYDDNIWAYNTDSNSETYFEFIRASDKVGLKWYNKNNSGFVNYSQVDISGIGNTGLFNVNTRVLSYSSLCDDSLLFEAERNIFGNNEHTHGQVNNQDKMKDLILEWCTNSITGSGDSQWNDYILQYEYSSNIKQRIFEWSVTNDDLYYYYAWDYDKNEIAFNSDGNYNNMSLYENDIHKSVFSTYNDETITLVSWRITNNGSSNEGEAYTNKVKLLQEYYVNR